MKKKALTIGVSVLALAFLAGVTVVGAQELGLIGNASTSNQQAIRVTQQQAAPSALNTDTNSFACAQVANTTTTKSTQTATLTGNVQEIVTQLEPYGYPALTVQKDIPVKWTIVADAATLNSCNNALIIPDYELFKSLEVGENVIEFTPTASGVVQYSCWMGMINATIAVVDDINNYDEAEIQAQVANIPQSGGCCGGFR